MIALVAPIQRVSTATAAEFMARQLEGQRLRVVLVVAPEPRHSGHKIRVVESRNPAWYRQLCADYLTRRTRARQRGDKYVDTAIKRRHVLRALYEISRGGVDGVRPPRAALRRGLRQVDAGTLFAI